MNWPRNNGFNHGGPSVLDRFNYAKSVSNNFQTGFMIFRIVIFRKEAIWLTIFITIFRFFLEHCLRPRVRERKKEQTYKDYVNPRLVVPQRLGLNAHGIYTNTLNG